MRHEAAPGVMQLSAAIAASCRATSAPAAPAVCGLGAAEGAAGCCGGGSGSSSCGGAAIWVCRAFWARREPVVSPVCVGLVAQARLVRDKAGSKTMHQDSFWRNDSSFADVDIGLLIRSALPETLVLTMMLEHPKLWQLAKQPTVCSRDGLCQCRTHATRALLLVLYLPC